MEHSAEHDNRSPLSSQELSMGMALGNVFRGSPSQLYLGIDPGLNRTGYAILRRSTGTPILIEGGIIRSTAAAPLVERLRELGVGLREVIEQFRPEAVAIEQVFSMPRNPKTAVLMAHARGAILLTVAEAEIPVVHYTPRQIKKLLTGSGNASKEQVQLAIQRELRLRSVLEPNDVADACAIALCHYYSTHLNFDLANAAS